MAYDFTSTTDRHNVGARKWDQMIQLAPNASQDCIPMSVADMEFKTAPEIVEGLKTFLDEQILGYSQAYPAFLEAIVDRMAQRHNWEIEPEWIVNTSGVVGALNVAVRTLTEPGEGVILFKPVYHPFSMAIEANERQEVDVPLLRDEAGYYTIDFAGFEEAAADPKNKLLLFCSPHNPVGRVWTREELEQVVAIAKKHDVYICADEIWHDIVMPGYEHTVIAKIDPSYNDHLIICTAPSKSFNIAGLALSNIIIPDAALRERFQLEVNLLHCGASNILGYKACEIAYREGDAWFEALMEVLDTNQRLVHEFITDELPMLNAPLIEGTFVSWVDCHELNFSIQELEAFLCEKAQFIVNQGYIFGQCGEQFLRINLALPTQELQKNLDKLKVAIDALQ